MLPDLPYAYDALEPHIDEKTMRIHHDKHHAAYTDKLNAAIEDTELKRTAVDVVLSMLDRLPENKRTAVRNNGGGYVNHNLYWEIMSPDGGGAPTGELATEINPYMYRLPPGYWKKVIMPYYLLSSQILMKIATNEKPTESEKNELTKLQKDMENLNNGGYVGVKGKTLPFGSETKN